MIEALRYANVVRQQQNTQRIIEKRKEENMIYLGIFYRDNGSVTIQEFSTIEAIKKWWKQKAHHYMTYDIYMAKCINKKFRIEGKYDKYIKYI